MYGDKRKQNCIDVRLSGPGNCDAKDKSCSMINAYDTKNSDLIDGNGDDNNRYYYLVTFFVYKCRAKRVNEPFGVVGIHTRSQQLV